MYSSLRLVRKLRQIADRAIPDGGLRGAWMRFKCIVRGLRYAEWMEPWIGFLEGCDMVRISAIRPRLYLKVQWPYINREYDATRRLEILRNHYRFVQERFSSELRERLLVKDFIYLARWNLAPTGVFSLRLAHTVRYGQEGEMALGLYHEELDRFCALFHFSITGESEISIGCLQGSKPVTDSRLISNKELISSFKKHMYGMRPKNFLLFAMRRVAQAWSISRLRGVSTEMQLWSENLRADYNAFWAEEGGMPAADGMYDVPVTVMLEEKSKRRSMYRRRNQCLEIIAREIDHVLAYPRHRAQIIDIAAAHADHAIAA